jgi:hypothetical protein
METDFTMRKWCAGHARIVEIFRPTIQLALKRVRCGFTPQWLCVIEATHWLYWLAMFLRHAQSEEVHALNHVPRLVTPDSPRPVEYKKPRWSKKKALPKPASISLADQETLLEGLLRWMDTMQAAVEAPPGECCPPPPQGLQAVLARNGYDPHSPGAPRRMMKEYFVV